MNRFVIRKYAAAFGLMFVLLMFSISAYAAGSESVSVGEYHTAVDLDIVVPVVITSASDVVGGSVKIIFNSSVVNVQGVTIGDFGTLVPNIQNADGYVYIAVAGANAVNKDTAILANVTFRGVSAASTTLVLQDVELNYEDGSLTTPSTTNGAIDVTGVPELDVTVTPTVTSAGDVSVNVTSTEELKSLNVTVTPDASSSTDIPMTPTSDNRSWYGSFLVQSDTPNGIATIFASGTSIDDLTGNTSAEFLIDTQAPVIRSVYINRTVLAVGDSQYFEVNATDNLDDDLDVVAGVYNSSGSKIGDLTLNRTTDDIYRFDTTVPSIPDDVYNIRVSATDDAGNSAINESQSITVSSPDLTVSLDVPAVVRLNETVYINATVSNIGGVASGATNLSIWVTSTVPVVDHSIPVKVLNASEQQVISIPWTATPSGNYNISVIVDPDDIVIESNEDNNQVDAKVAVRYTDLAVRIQSRYEVVLNSTETIRVIVRNLGTMDSEPSGLRVYVNSTSTEIINATVPTIPPGNTSIFQATWTADEEGVHSIDAYLDDLTDTDVNPDNDNDSRTVNVKDYTINVWNMYYPYYPVYEERYFYVSAYVDANYAGVINATISFDRSGINAIMPTKSVAVRDGSHNYIYWRVKADDIGKYNATIEVSAFNKTSVINTTSDKTSTIRNWWGDAYNYTYSPHGPINVIAETVIVKDLNWTTVSDSQSDSLGYQVFNVTEIDEPARYWWQPSKPGRSLQIDVSAGAEGRLLMGLEYLVGYPHGCPEQVMSPMLAAKRVEQYYLKRGVLTTELNDSLYQKVKKSVSLMSPTGTANRQQIPGIGDGSGGWAWGLSRPSMFYTVYPHYALGVVANNANYSHLISEYNINLNESTRWIADHQNTDGSWTGRGYIYGDVPMTGFVMMALNQTVSHVNETMYNSTVNATEDAVAYLLGKQNDDGGWSRNTGSSDGYSTSFTLMGLLQSGNNSDVVVGAINNGTSWLIANQHTDGSWSKYPGSQSYSWYGDMSETTAYASIALNMSGLPSDSDMSVIGGVHYLVGVYQDRGSWGSTRSTAAAVYALTELQVPAVFEKDVNIVVEDVIDETFRLNETNGGVTISSLPKPSLLKDRMWIEINRTQLDDIGLGNHTVDISTTYINGDDVDVLVAVESKQNARKKEAFAKVPWKYIDPIADNFTLALDLPDGIKDGDTVTANATITEDGTSDLYVMILEVPLSSNVTFPNTYPANTTYYIDANGSAVVVQHLYNASDNMLYIYPGSDDESQPSVLKGESKSFYFNVTMLGFGEQTIESNVKPMYNDPLMAIANVTTTVKGYGNVTVDTVDINDSAVIADVVIDCSSGTTVRKLEGDYSASITLTGYVPVNTSVSIAPGSSKTYTAKLTTSASEPVAVFYETETAALPATVTGVVTKVYNFTVQSNGGRTIVALETPANHTVIGATVDGVNATTVSEEGGITYIETELTGDSQYEVNFKAPYVVGDFSADDIVDFNDVVYLAKHYYLFPGYETLRSPADFTRDGTVDFNDVVYLAKHYYMFPGYENLNPL